MTPHDNPERCKEIFALLSDYLNLELPSDACRAIEQHLAGCAPCIEFANSLRTTVALCRQYEPSEMPAIVSDQARERLRKAYFDMIAARQQQT